MRGLLLLLCLLTVKISSAQQRIDTSNQVAVTITNARYFEAQQIGALHVNKLIGDVALEQRGTLFYCDSAYLDLEKNNLEAFGSVRIIQPGGTEVSSDYLRYTGNQKLAYLRGDVHLLNGTDNLWTDELTYKVDTKVGNYTTGGTLQTATTALSSDKGTYNARTKESRFTGNVLVTDPEYNVVSDDLGYNSATKLVRFFAPSVVTNDKSQLRTTSGTYDSKAEVARFTKRSSIWSGAQYVEGDTMDYDRRTGLGAAHGRVMALDTAQHITMWSNRASVNEKFKSLLATVKPVLRRVSGLDTVYMRADTFLSAPAWILKSGKAASAASKDSSVNQKSSAASRRTAAGRRMRAADTSNSGSRAVVSPTIVNLPSAAADTASKDGISATEQRHRTDKADSLKQARSAAPLDTTRFFIGFHHVLVFSDSLQARCDSIAYTQSDSTLRMMIDPVAWSRAAQVTGDTLILQNDSGKIRSLYIPANAFVVSQSGPDKAKLYDQVQGKTLRGHFTNNVLTDIVVWPSAESIYYPKDDSDRYLGVNQAESERMTVYFDNQSIQRILLEQEPKQTMTPLQKADLANMRLSRFRWRAKERPKSVDEIFQ
jgi:lipopolysaccharide export system protein LptA